LRDANELHGNTLQAGKTLQIPAPGSQQVAGLR